MLKVLLKKQLMEVFKSYFYDAKKNKMRSKGAIAGWIIFFVLIMAGVLGGMFTALSLSMCAAMTKAGMDWLYFLLMGGVAVFLGTFGSVFNTYAGLYLAKDNDLLLSMPIPVRTLMAARLINVYLMGTMYASTALIPAQIVYWIIAGPTVNNIICGIALFIIISLFVLLLSCVLGWVVAKVSLKLKNKSFISVLISLIFIGGYYFFYFKAGNIVEDIIKNAAVYGEKIKGSAYVLYLFGSIGEGNLTACAIFAAVIIAACSLVWYIMARSFIKIATSSGNISKVRYKEKRAKSRGTFGALLGKEFARFTSSPSYMLNCGLSVLLIPACGVFLLIKGYSLGKAFDDVFGSRPGATAVILCTMLCLLASMNDMAAPSVSLEGKNIWIAQSLPVAPKMVLRAKAAVQLILTAVPILFTSICVMIIVDTTLPVKILILIMAMVFTFFLAVFDTVLSVRLPNLTWTNEITPIKQSAAIFIAMFGGWVISAIFPVVYLIIGYKLGAAVYLSICSAVLAIVSLILLRWLNTRGAKIFASL